LKKLKNLEEKILKKIKIWKNNEKFEIKILKKCVKKLKKLSSSGSFGKIGIFFIYINIFHIDNK
jgi:hypothetical protein|tara:strand:- start:1203 stop:1394 length:192 start_codon:yes stop_codon:yes gene_type:complete